MKSLKKPVKSKSFRKTYRNGKVQKWTVCNCGAPLKMGTTCSVCGYSYPYIKEIDKEIEKKNL
jgi:hypothetical protein